MTGTMCAVVRDELRLWYRTPTAAVAPRLPRGLELVRRGPWAFWCVRARRVEGLRPEGVPAWCGVSYSEVSYGLLVRAMTRSGDVRSGTLVVRQEVDAQVASVLAERWANAPLQAASVSHAADDVGCTYRVDGTECAAGDAVLRVQAGSPVRPGDSCFPSPRDAEESLRAPPLELGIVVESGVSRLTRVLASASGGVAEPVRVVEARLRYFEANACDVTLEWATRSAAAEHCWRALEPEVLMPGELQHTHLPRRREAGKPAEASPAEAA